MDKKRHKNMGRKHLLDPVSVIGRLLAVKCWADHNYIHAAMGQCDEEQETSLHEVRHLSGESGCHKD
jgi:hypothetical protein